MAEKKVIFEKLSENARIPERQHEGDAGYDIYSSEEVILKKGDTKLVSTGLKMKLPEGIEAQIRPRSGLSLSGITVMNAPGTIDPGYRGEIKIILGNLLKKEFKIEKGDRIAQMIFSKVEHPKILLGNLDKTERGEDGFGSTGL